MERRELLQPGSVLIDDFNLETGVGKSYVFTHPRDVITASSFSEIADAILAIENLQAQGRYLAGYISYNAGLALDRPFTSSHNPDMPLLWFGVYDSVCELDYNKTEFGDWDSVDLIDNLRLDVSENDYVDCIELILDYISAGDVYQVNYTCKLLFENFGTAAGLFMRLRNAHPVCHSAFINAGDFQVISLSPELFLRRTGDKLLTRPMKGTTRRGRYPDEDSALRSYLQSDEKNRAENIMIVDLMRNDFGRICKYGEISVPKLFHVEQYRSVFQMTSDVEGCLRDDVTLSEIMKATFPPGSVTGTPKLRALEIIDELESNSRGVYCGCIGMFMPGKDFLLNVAIRTIVQKGNECTLGLGGGIVADSNPVSELQEVLLKSKFVQSEPVGFQLIETMLYQVDNGYVYLDEHIERMHQSAKYFGWQFPESAIRAALDDIKQAARVRLLLFKDGAIDVQCSSIDPAPGDPVKLLLASERTDPDDVFLYHKTTQRRMYDESLRNARDKGYFDVLYMNNAGEITECAITNIALEIDGCWYTPPLTCGLLPGIWRKQLLADSKAIERVLTLDDLNRATCVIIGNSVRGSMEVSCIEDCCGDRHLF